MKIYQRDLVSFDHITIFPNDAFGEYKPIQPSRRVPTMRKKLTYLLTGIAATVLTIFLSQFAVRSQALPIFVIDATKMPNIAAHVKQAQAQGQPSILTYIGAENNSLNTNNRNAACRLQPIPRPPGQQCDEYPFASTYEGGATASAVLVPGGENQSQGGSLSKFYASNNLQKGSRFQVMVSGAPSVSKNPNRTPNFSGNCQCPYDFAIDGSFCGGRSAYSRSGGGYRPACYIGERRSNSLF